MAKYLSATAVALYVIYMFAGSTRVVSLMLSYFCHDKLKEKPKQREASGGTSVVETNEPTETAAHVTEEVGTEEGEPEEAPAQAVDASAMGEAE